MFAFIRDLAITMIAGAAVLIVTGLAVFSVVKEKKKKTGGCTGNCATCGMGCSHNKKD